MEEFIKKNLDKSWQEIADLVNDKFGTTYSANAIRNWSNRRNLHRGMAQMARNKKPTTVEEDVALHTAKQRKTEADKKNRVYLKKIAELQRVVEEFERVTPVDSYTIKPKLGKNKGEGTVVVLASDWHIEERVDPDTINGLNTHSLAIARQRGDEFFQAALRLTEILGRDVEIKDMVLALLGDFITGSIHEEMLETAEVEPALAIIEAQRMLTSGIQFLLDNSALNLVIPCHSGNHARTTKETRHATEAGHSYEYLMYHMLADHFRGNSRVKFIIPRSYHSFLDVYGTTIRFHHGHNIRYGGGIGGLTIPVNKAIAQWNKSRVADLDCFGHWHTRFDGGNFVANGSNIGFNAFAVSIKASFDRPSQTLFLIDKKRGKTATWPISYTV